MRATRIFSRKATAGAADVAAHDRLGLDAFLPEPAPEIDAASTSVPARSVWLWGLAVLALVEAVPAALWVQDYLQAADVPAIPAVAAAAAPATTPPCDPLAAPPAPQPPAQAAAAAALVGAAAPARPAGVVAGRVAFVSAVPLRVYEGSRLLGTTESETLLLPVGAHDLQFVNDDVGYRGAGRVTVVPERTATFKVDLPTATLHVNALPWAEVWIDNQRVGETPLGNIQQSVGPHEVVFRHPQLGERRTRVMVTLKEPTRVSVDLRKR